jgi:hypothetical protein
VIEAYAYLNLKTDDADRIYNTRGYWTIDRTFVEFLNKFYKSLTPEEIAAGKKRASELQKEIEAKIARKKQLAQQVSQQKTIAKWVSEFFTEYEKTKRLDGTGYPAFAHLALSRLNVQLSNLDRNCRVNFADSSEDDNLVVEIRWSKHFAQANNCEEVLIFDASSAFFQSAIEDI